VILISTRFVPVFYRTSAAFRFAGPEIFRPYWGATKNSTASRIARCRQLTDLEPRVPRSSGGGWSCFRFCSKTRIRIGRGMVQPSPWTMTLATSVSFHSHIKLHHTNLRRRKLSGSICTDSVSSDSRNWPYLISARPLYSLQNVGERQSNINMDKMGSRPNHCSCEYGRLP
jgi:hypothetical protein